MKTYHPLRKTLTFLTPRFATAALFLATATLPASAGTKEQLIQLQTQVQALQDQMARMQQSFDERMGVMRNLIEQTTDGVNKMTASVDELNKSLLRQSNEAGSKVDQVSAQVEALHDSVDELKVRLAKVTKQLEEIQAMQQNLAAPPVAAVPAAATQAPPADVLYSNALRDYNAARYDLAQQQFADYMKFYADTDLAGNSQFYLGEILYRGGDYQHAIQEYGKVLELYPGGNKSAAAQLKKGYALIEMGDRAAGIKELKAVVARYPRSAEGAQAQERLKKLRAAPAAAKPSRGGNR